MRELQTAIADTDQDDDEFAFWSYDDLLARNIVNDRADIWKKQREFGFPQSVKLGSNKRQARALWIPGEVKAWVKANLITTIERIEANAEAQPRKRGRPPKSDAQK